MMKCELCGSRGDARRLLQQNGVELDGQKAAFGLVVTKEQLQGDGVILKKGKKVYHRAYLA